MNKLHILPTDKPSRLYINSRYKHYEFCEIPRISTQHKKCYNIYITSDEEIKEGYYYDLTHNIVMKSIFYQSSDKNCKKIILTTDQDLIADGVQAIDDEFLKWFVKNPSCEEVKTIKVPYFDESGCSHLLITPKEEPKLTNVCIKCGVDLYYADNFACQEHPKNCKGIHLSEETLKERALKEETKQDKIMERFIANAKQQETLEEAALSFLPRSEVDNDTDFITGFEFGAKWQQETYNQFTLAMDDLKSSREGYLKAKEEYELKQQERSYSEEEVENIIQKLMYDVHCGDICEGDKIIDFKISPRKWFEQFKKK
jgi:hypothetical protein